MHLVAEHGAAAHWAYTEDKDREADEDTTGLMMPGSPTSGPWTQVTGQSFSRAVAKLGEVDCAHEFMHLVRQELLGTRVFVFTEKGRSTRILNLARGATLGDAALMLNSSLYALARAPTPD